MWHPLLVAASAALLLTPGFSQDWVLDDQFLGDAAGDQFGFTLAGLGDLDGDGFDDFLVTAFTADINDTNSGAFYLISGETGSRLNQGNPVTGDGLRSMLGYSCVLLGEHRNPVTGDADGIIKFAVAAPFDSTIFPWGGKVSIYRYDAANDVVIEETEIFGDAPGEAFGAGLGTLDDDGDGYLELAVGAVGANSLAGEVHLLRGGWIGASFEMDYLYTLGGGAPGDLFGYSIISAGDVFHNDGRDELLVGAPYADMGGSLQGAIVLFLNHNMVLALTSGVNNSLFGWDMDGGLDINGDGWNDFAIGAPGAGNGSVYIHSGLTGALLHEVVGDTAGGQFGYSVALLDDVNADGVADLAVGAPFGDGGNGHADVINLNAAGGPASLHSMTGPSSGSRFGWSIGPAGDIDLTGTPDILVGAPRTTFGGQQKRGLVEAWVSPDLGGADLKLVDDGNNYVWDSTITFTLTEIKPTADRVDFYWGTNQNGSSAGGYSLDIGNLNDGASSNPFATVNGPFPQGAAQVTLTIPNTLAGGSFLIVQAGETRGGFTRVSNLMGAEVEEAPFSLQMIGDLKASTTIELKTIYGTPNNLVYFAWSGNGGPLTGGLGSGTTQNNILGPEIDWGMVNPMGFPDFVSMSTKTQNPFTIASDGTAITSPVFVDPSMVGLQIWFQAAEWSIIPQAQQDQTAVLDAGVVVP
jgi:hypothetical protein